MLDARARMSPVRANARDVRVLIGWGALIAVSFAWGHALVRSGARLDLGAPPFWSPLAPHPGPAVVPAVAFAGVAVYAGPSLARTLRWSAVLLGTAAANLGWAIVLARVDGAHALTDPLGARRNDYLQTARSIESLPTFLGHFVANIATYNQHTKGHPPGMVVVEWLLLRVGLASVGVQVALSLLGGAAATVAAIVALRDLAGERAARAAAPFLALVPAVIWWQTADAFYAGVSAWSVTLLVLASSRDDGRAFAFAFSAGVLFAITAFFSYGLVLLVIVAGTVCLARRRVLLLFVAAAGAAPVFVAFAVSGFSWWRGFAATRHVYWTGVAIHRPYSYFVVANIAVLSLAIGPATAVAFGRLRDRATWLLAGAGVAVVALADLSGMSKGEVERIWLPFVPWLMLATAAFAHARLGTVRALLTLQVASTVVLAVTIWSQW